jgi:hypothetical protein
MGYCRQVGPVTNCTFHFDYILDQLVCFYEPTSTKVDWAEVEAFLEPYWSAREGEGGQRRKCNAMNFNHCISYLEAQVQKQGQE